MYFVVIMAFALVLSDNLPPEQLNLWGPAPWADGRPVLDMALILLGEFVVVAVAALVASRISLGRLGRTLESHDRATGAFARSQMVLLGIIAAALAATMLFTPWVPLVRAGSEDDPAGIVEVLLRFAGDMFLLVPFFASLLLTWTILYRAELRIRTALIETAAGDGDAPIEKTGEDGATAALAAAKRKRPFGESSLCTYLLDKFRHQVLIVAIPMSIIVLAKHFTDQYRTDLRAFTSLLWAPDALLGVLSVCILACAPSMLRHIWATEPLPPGPLRDRFVKICGRIGLRYREILLWHTHGMAINAAVMGFVAPWRYILVSDALLETMTEDEIEAVFSHEAGHVRHWHLQFFVLFALLSMYIAGGLLEVLWRLGLQDLGLLQLIALAVLLLSWLFGFGWLSRRFERQADLFGVRCVAPEVKECLDWCPVHGRQTGPGLCVTASNAFGRTLGKIADLNGIPRDAPSWRHGTIESRCRLIEKLTLDTVALRKFDRSLFLIKVVLFVACLAGTIVAAWLYWPDVARALNL
ncbi:MAG: M48 family metallopeptidase [Planctomycetota bacterium]